MICPHCGKDVKNRKALISELAKLAGVKEFSLRALSIDGCMSLIEAWKGKKKNAL